MFRIAIYGITGTGTPVTQFLEGEAVVENWSKRISAPGKMTFSVPAASAKATATNLQLYRRVRLYRQRRDGSGVFDAVWYGYIEATKQIGPVVQVACTGALGLLKKRVANAFYPFLLPGSAGAFLLLSQTNANYGDTGFVAGTGDSGTILGSPRYAPTAFVADPVADTLTVTSNRLANDELFTVWNTGGALPSGLSSTRVYYVVNVSSSFTFQVALTPGGAPIDITSAGSGTNVYYKVLNLKANGTIDLLRALEVLATAYQEEFEIDDAGNLNFVSALGTNRTDVKLIYRRDGSVGTNVREIEIGEDGQDMANLILATNSASLSYQWNDMTSWATYGELVEHKQFDEATDLATLTQMASTYGALRSVPLPDFRVVPVGAVKTYNPATDSYAITGLDYAGVGLGDLITADIVTENRTVQEARRIAGIDVTVGDNDDETVALTLSKAGLSLTANTPRENETQELRRRIRELESLL